MNKNKQQYQLPKLKKQSKIPERREPWSWVFGNSENSKHPKIPKLPKIPKTPENSENSKKSRKFQKTSKTSKNSKMERTMVGFQDPSNPKHGSFHFGIRGIFGSFGIVGSFGFFWNFGNVRNFQKSKTMVLAVLEFLEFVDIFMFCKVFSLTLSFLYIAKVFSTLHPPHASTPKRGS